MVDRDAIHRQIQALHDLYDAGKLSYAALCVKVDALQAQLSAACKHRKKTTEHFGVDGYIVWCDEDECGVELERKKDSGGAEASSGSTSSRGGCVVAGIAVAGVASGLIWWAADVIGSIL